MSGRFARPRSINGGRPSVRSEARAARRGGQRDNRRVGCSERRGKRRCGVLAVSRKNGGANSCRHAPASPSTAPPHGHHLGFTIRRRARKSQWLRRSLNSAPRCSIAVGLACSSRRVRRRRPRRRGCGKSDRARQCRPSCAKLRPTSAYNSFPFSYRFGDLVDDLSHQAAPGEALGLGGRLLARRPTG